MIQVEPILLKNYCAILNKNRMPENEQHAFIKWLRYYLDFCHKYGFNKNDPGSLSCFIDKLKSKKQTPKATTAGFKCDSNIFLDDAR